MIGYTSSFIPHYIDDIVIWIWIIESFKLWKIFQPTECTCTIQNYWKSRTIVTLNKWNVSRILLPQVASGVYEFSELTS